MQFFREFLVKVGANINKFRKKQHISQEELALSSNISMNYISKLERGKTNPSIKQLNKICRRLHIKLYDLFKDIDI